MEVSPVSTSDFVAALSTSNLERQGQEIVIPYSRQTPIAVRQNLEEEELRMS